MSSIFALLEGSLPMMRSLRQGCPASGYLFTMTFDPLYRWLLVSAIPLEPRRPWFL